MKMARVSLLLLVSSALAFSAIASAADPGCADDSGNIYVDCGNGTVTDNRTGLVWLANAECFGGLDWDEAMKVVAGLGDLQCSPKSGDCDCGLDDGSSPGEWRLPSSDELTAMVEAAEKLGCSLMITNDAGNDCWDQQCVEVGACSLYRVQPLPYWTSTAVADFAFAKHLATFPDLPPDLRNAPALPRPRDSRYPVWPVRGEEVQTPIKVAGRGSETRVGPLARDRVVTGCTCNTYRNGILVSSRRIPPGALCGMEVCQ